MIPISEIFTSIQGEGPFTGQPCVFVRVGGCNFKCPGFGPNGCDSNFSVDGKYKKEWKSYKVEDLLVEIGKKAESINTKLIVFTGGEPFIHQDFMQVAAVASQFFKVQIETNGSKFGDINLFAFNLSNLTIVASPKLGNSGNAFNYKESMLNLHPSNVYFKFVVKDERDVQEVAKFVDLFLVPKENVYLMPLGENIEQLNESAKFVWETCIKMGWKYSDRLHIRIYNDKRGV